MIVGLMDSIGSVNSMDHWFDMEHWRDMVRWFVGPSNQRSLQFVNIEVVLVSR